MLLSSVFKVAQDVVEVFVARVLRCPQIDLRIQCNSRIEQFFVRKSLCVNFERGK